jgi:hypothetical protein
MTAMGYIATCMAEDNEEAMAVVDCLGDNLVACVEPYVCAGIFECGEEDYKITFS